jgi:CheY-like chemotaxis protein
MVLNFNPTRILLADDDRDDHYLFGEFIRRSGLPITVSAVMNGPELLDYLDKNIHALPDALFLDINMPLKNGIDCLVDIRKNPAFDAMPVIMFSTSDYKKDVEETFKGGANLYINKGLFFSNAIKTLKQVLALPRGEYFPPTEENYYFQLKKD